MARTRGSGYLNAVAQAEINYIGPDAYLQIRTGAPGAPGSGTLLFSVSCGPSAFGVINPAVPGEYTVESLSFSPAVASGTPGHYELYRADGTFCESGLVDGSDGITALDDVSVGQNITTTSQWIRKVAGA